MALFVQLYQRNWQTLNKINSGTGKKASRLDAETSKQTNESEMGKNINIRKQNLTMQKVESLMICANDTQQTKKQTNRTGEKKFTIRSTKSDLWNGINIWSERRIFICNSKKEKRFH